MAQRLRRLRGFLQKAITERLAMHLWLHPSLQPRDYELLLIPFLRTCAELREKGHLDVLTMEGLVAAVDTT